MPDDEEDRRRGQRERDAGRDRETEDEPWRVAFAGGPGPRVGAAECQR